MAYIPLLAIVGLAVIASEPAKGIRSGGCRPMAMESAIFIESTNYDERPEPVTVDTVVVHATVIPTVEQTVLHFRSPETKVSAHYVVGREGEIVQMVPDENRAWHAGVSELGDRKRLNDFSVGIEIVNLNDGIEPFTGAQYQAVANIIKHLRKTYTITDDRIVSHEEIARPRGRKNDPKGFDFNKLKELAK